ncbi:MAG: DNA repair protein RecO [Bacteroidia bacterium]|nr:DNA repair protein RecO [Bacteroidia bacterium]
MIEKTEAVVLKSIKYGDTSRIVTLYTREFGKMSVIAKGARAAKSRFGAALDVMSRSDIVLYRKEHRELQLLSQADLLQQYKKLIADPPRLMAGFAVLEFTHAAVQGEEAHEELYELLTSALARLDESREDALITLLRFLIGLTHALGIGFDMLHCINCRTALSEAGALRDRAAFSIAHGGCTCSSCTPKADSFRIDLGTVQLLQVLRPSAEIPSVNPDTPHRITQEGVYLLHKHLSAHIDGMRRVKSMRLLDAFDEGR